MVRQKFYPSKMDVLERVSQHRWVLRRAREEKRSSLN